MVDDRVPQTIACGIGMLGYAGYLDSDMHADYVAGSGVLHFGSVYRC